MSDTRTLGRRITIGVLLVFGGMGVGALGIVWWIFRSTLD
jgi:hypothetical protein